MTPEEYIILVNSADEQIGALGKMEVHTKGLLHRGFSIFIQNEKGDFMLQKRAMSKYHSGGLWTNTCCGHPRDGEELEAATRRRLQEEMGFDCPLSELFVFTYKVNLDNGLIENEIDHVFIGTFEGEPRLNPQEADDWKWIPRNVVETDTREHPDRYTYWFNAALRNWPSAEGK